MTNQTGRQLVARGATPVPAVMAEDDFLMMWRIAKALAASGVFKDVRQSEQAFAKILLGRDLGLSPAESMNAMDFVKGNVMLRSVTLASFVKRHERYDYRVVEHTEAICSIEFYEVVDGNRDLIGTSTFTIEDARAAKLVRPDSAWAAHPRNMLFARAMSNGTKWYCPDVVGGVPVYTEGDSFYERPQLGVGDDAEPTGATLPDAVEAVLARAAKLGHVGLADRATAEMTVLGQSDAMVSAWVERANSELDAMEPVTNATVADDEPDLEPLSDAEELRDQAQALLDTAAEFRESGDPDEARVYEEQAAEMMAEADALDPAANGGI